MTHSSVYEKTFVMMIEGTNRRIDNACEIARIDRGQFLRDAINTALDKAFQDQFEPKKES